MCEVIQCIMIDFLKLTLCNTFVFHCLIITTIKALFRCLVLPCIDRDFVSCTFTPYPFIVHLIMFHHGFILITLYNHTNYTDSVLTFNYFGGWTDKAS